MSMSLTRIRAQITVKIVTSMEEFANISPNTILYNETTTWMVCHKIFNIKNKLI